MAHTVGEQVVHRSPQQEGVRLDGGQGLGGKVNLEREALGHAAVEKIGGSLPEKAVGVDRLFAQGLHGTVQPHGQVQVVDQVPDGLALGADDGRLFLAGGGEIRRFLQLRSVPHHHR